MKGLRDLVGGLQIFGLNPNAFAYYLDEIENGKQRFIDLSTDFEHKFTGIKFQVKVGNEVEPQHLQFKHNTTSHTWMEIMIHIFCHFNQHYQVPFAPNHNGVRKSLLPIIALFSRHIIVKITSTV